MRASRIAHGSIALALAALATLLAGCGSNPSTRTATASRIDAILAAPHRPAENRARDVHRHPRQTLLFFGIRPEMTVVEISPTGGWYTEILAPLLRERGTYVAGLGPRVEGNANSVRQHENFRAFLSRHPEVFDRVQIGVFDPGRSQLVPDGTADMVVTFRNLHNWMARGVAVPAIADMYRALKPGGVLGIVEHRGPGGTEQDPRAPTGYVNQDYAIALFESAGFRLVATSEINANPRDTKDHPGGVWALPPMLSQGDRDRDRYLAIGESDRFTLKFVKPR
jgi:predicted methyltransferase